MVATTFQSVMVTDSRDSSRPMLVPINNPDEANSAFDSISYSKVYNNILINIMLQSIV